MPLRLKGIVDILDCDPGSIDNMGGLIRDRLNKSTQLVTSMLAHFTDHEKIERVIALYSELDQSYQARLLLSAEIGETLTSFSDSSSHGAADPAILDKVLDIVSRENAFFHFESDGRTEYLHKFEGERFTSPLGDRTLIRTHSDNWILHPGYLIDEIIAVDFDSPLATRYEPDSGTLSAPRLELSEDEKRIAVDKLTLTLHNIDIASPIHGQVIRNFVRRIVVRKTAESDRVFDLSMPGAPFGSEHRPIHPSSLRALNIQHPQKTVAACMETLFHETIHNVLAYWETVYEHFAPSSRSVRPVSPWTGNAIPNHSFAHACFVWYGLHRLFENSLRVVSRLDGVTSRQMIDGLNRFGAGFLIDYPLSSHFTHSQGLHDGLKESIDYMQAKIRAEYVHCEVA